MDDLIKALQILRKYGNPESPTSCKGNEMIVNIKAKDVSEEDKHTLEKLGFFILEELGVFYSYRFG
jgi:hypothetical protein